MTETELSVRFCSSCGTTKVASDFYPSYKTQCRACLKRKAEPTRDAKLQYMRRWKLAHPSAFNSWEQAHKAERVEYRRAYRERNKDRLTASYAAWAKANPHIVNALIAKRTAAKLRATPQWADANAIRAFYAEAARLTRATGIRHEVDHIYPLQGREVTGFHCEANLQIMTKVENIRKGNKMPEVAA